MPKASTTPSKAKKPRMGLDLGQSMSGSKPPATPTRNRTRVWRGPVHPKLYTLKAARLLVATAP